MARRRAAILAAATQGPRSVVCAVARGSLRRCYPGRNYGAHCAHQMRHTNATSMLRGGVSLPALMKLLGHRTANMTLRYVEITQKDLQREFHLARQSPRHLIPLPASLNTPDPDLADATTVLDRISTAIRLLDRFRQQNH